MYEATLCWTRSIDESRECTCPISVEEDHRQMEFAGIYWDRKRGTFRVKSCHLGFFTYYTVAMGEVNPSGPVPIDSVFIYRPDKRLELWRFAFYMFLHAG
ncbi:hypothetical protein G9C98_000105 [Cotesia typhae]|uniref:Uncharacterized protein n=1 Tax=Cotesia typhae TaxID=2053667 RepID=A0A8J5RL08_9HYME|nr:hypothetical protein G9C98_000105 [Cotesia typhae]